MRIVIDLQGAQTESRFRGIGRYSLSLTQAIARNRGNHEILIILSNLFPETIEPIKLAFNKLLPPENILVWYAAGPVREIESNNTERREISEKIRESFIEGLQPDIVYISSLFEGYVDDAITSINIFKSIIPVAVTLYDLIPLLNPEVYLISNPSYNEYYQRKINHLKQASALIAISEFSADEAREALNLDGTIVTNISTACSDIFRPLAISSADKKNLYKHFNISRKTILYSGGSDGRKNLHRLIRAYALLPETLRKTHQLVMVGKMPEGDVYALKETAQSVKVNTDELLFTGYVTDEELAQFYNLCELFVFPSWHEGFGLPALEAMSCGAAVIAANTSSLPEVINNKKALFDPFDEKDIAFKINDVLTNKAFHHELVKHGLEQAKNFSWDKSATAAITAFEKVAVKQNISFSWKVFLQKQQKLLSQLINSIAEVSKLACASDFELRQISINIAKNMQTIENFHRRDNLPNNIIWRIEGPFDSSYSLALVNRELAFALEQQGINVVLHSTDGPGDFTPNEQFLKRQPLLAKMYEKASSISSIEADLVSRNLYPPRVNDMQGKINLLHNYAWEESGFPQAWVENFNDYLQGIACVSNHVKKLLIDNGVTTSLVVTGNGVDHWQRVEADKNFKLSARTFRLLHISSCFPRKGADLLLKAYGNAFSNQNDISLIIKTFPNPHNQIHEWLAMAKKENSSFPDVIIIEEDLSDNQLKALYEQCHVLVAPSLAEGFGLPMAEAMLSGLAVITTNWGGQLDFCNHDTAWLVDYSFERAKTHFNLFNSVWAVPNIKDLSNKMYEVYTLPEQQRKKRAEAGKELLLQNFRWSHVAERLLNSARRFVEQKYFPKPRIGWITTWNTRCGIASYSEHLIRSLPEEIHIFAAHAATQTQKDTKNVSRCWQQSEEDKLTELSHHIEQANINSLVIQFNYGFFNFEILVEFLLLQLKMGRIIIIALHATIDPSTNVHKKLSILVPALVRCHRILVHTPADLNRLKNYGLTDNVALFPHGVLDYNATANIKSKTSQFTIASYGFFLPHKGLLELIEAVALLRQNDIDIKLHMVNAKYPENVSIHLIMQAKKLINELNLNKYIKIFDDYLSDKESLDLLAQTDLIVFPYQNTAESSSAAVRTGLATNIPVAVTPLEIFEDVSPAVFKLSGYRPSDIAQGIEALYNEIKFNSSVIQQKMEKAQKWRNAHYYSVLSQRLYNMVNALFLYTNKG